MFLLRKKTTSPFLYVWIVTGVIFALKCAFILSSTLRELASTTWIIDDSIIEMAVARNVAEGLGFTLDGVHTTSGAPFLWIYMTSLTHALLSLEGAFKATLILSTFFGSLATVVTYALALKLTEDRRVAWTAFILASLTATAFFNAMNGMETTFFTLVALLSVGTFLGLGKPAKWSAFAWGCVTGLLMGLTVMTRGDGLFVIVTLVLVKAYEWYASKGAARKNDMKTLLGMLLLAGICFGIFMLWQYLQAGSLQPGNQVGRREMSMSLHGFSYDAFSLARYLKIVVWNDFQLEELLRIATGSSLLAITALASGLLTKNLRALGSITLVYVAIFFTLLVTYQWYFPDFHGLRYINFSIHLFFIFIAALLWRLPEARLKPAVIGILTFCIIGVAGYRHYNLSAHMPWASFFSYIARPSQEDLDTYWKLIDWMDDNLPANTVVGVRDYGRVTLFTDLTIQDISGNIYTEAALTLNDGTLDEYLKSRDVEYLLIPTLEQRQDRLYRYLHEEMNLQLVEGAPRVTTQNLYKIIW